MTDIKFIERHVYRFFDGNRRKIEKWFNSGNPFFGGLSPDNMIMKGHGYRVRQFINEMLKDLTNGR